MEQSINVITIKLCKCGRAPHRVSGRNCHFCNRDAQKRYRAGLKGLLIPGYHLEFAKENGGTGPDGFIYFIRAGERGLIKIGFSADPCKRIRALQTASSFQLFLMGAITAKKSYERVLHEKFAAYRDGGEWFEPAKELLEFIYEFTGRNTLSA